VLSSRAVATAPRDMQGRAAAPRAATGALWGAAAAGLLVSRLPPSSAVVLLAVGAGLGAAAALAMPAAEALRHPGLATIAALAGVSMMVVPEPTFFLLVPLLAAATAWPLALPEGEAAERPLPRWAMPAVFAAAAAAFFGQSAHRHWTFASGGRDLGLFYQTHWLIAHGQPLLNTVMGMPVFADHMTLDDFLVAPLLRLHDSATTLLLVQALVVASAVFPAQDMAARLLGRPRFGLGLALAWVLAPDVQMGVMFDYNQTPFASALLVWTAWALAGRGPVAVCVTAILACGAKGNFCLYVAVLALVLSWRTVPWRRGLAVAVLALALFVVELTVLFPWFRAGGFRHWEFEELGQGPREIAVSLATRPWHAAALLADHTQKRRSLLLPLSTTGYLGLADPLTLVLQLPNWGERFLSTHRTRWWGYYYGMPAVAMALVGAVLGARRLQEAGQAGTRLGGYVTACALLVGVFPPYKTQDGDRRSPLYTSRRPYAATDEDVRTQEHAVRFVGRDPRLKVAAQYHLLPHLAGRPYIYELDHAPDADVVALQLDGGTWPDGRPSWRRRVQEVWATGRFHVGFCEGQTVVLYRGPEPSVACPAWEAFLAGAPPAASAEEAAPPPP
jgi:uncharacterized membrane protein